jgi:selenocysteine-specific elongation factor
VILGTAGHIDHGKTALVKALTGVDTDRLPEEQRRGITIELGFAPLVLPGGPTIGVVDVPGHEAFVRTMLAGASGIDLALLVVAADEGVMPQTREHLSILELLDIRGGVIALTKSDLVDADWLALVRDDVATAVAGSPLEGAPQIPVSVVTSEGLDALRTAIGAAVHDIPRRNAEDIFRLPVDRSFSVRGTGTVVTGTVWSGRLRRDDVVRVLPGGQTARVRGLQSHGHQVDAAEPGSRLAVNLGGIDVADVPRGSTLVTDLSWEPVDVLRADVTMLPDAPVIGPRTRVRLHLGTREVGARVVVAAPQNTPRSRASGQRSEVARSRTGSWAPARIVLDEPITVRGGDRFVLRAGSPMATVGGGVVTDAGPGQRRARPWTAAGVSVVDRVVAMVREAGVRGVRLDRLPVRAGIRPAETMPTVTAIADRAEVLGESIFDREALGSLGERAVALVAAHHARAPLDEGLSLQSLRTGLSVSPAVADLLIARVVASGGLEVDHGLVRRAGWRVQPSVKQQGALDTIVQAIQSAGREPPSVSELAHSVGGDTAAEVAALLRVLERGGAVRQVESDRYYAAEALAELTEALRRGMVPGREYGPAELREFLGVSRKYLIPLLEYYDRTGLTERRASGRVIAGQRPGTGSR